MGKVKYNANQENAKINIYSSMIYTTWQNKRDILNNKLTIQVGFTKTVFVSIGNINTHSVNCCQLLFHNITSLFDPLIPPAAKNTLNILLNKYIQG